MYLIFEFGEVESVLYLFEDEPKWNGSDLCARSAAVSMDSSTASGLRLGLAPEEVKSILGEPNVATAEKLIYCFDYKTKTSPDALAQLRKTYSKMSDAEFGKNFEYCGRLRLHRGPFCRRKTELPRSLQVGDVLSSKAYLIID